MSATQPTEWKWDVKPTAAGKQTLYLTLTAHFIVEGRPLSRTIKSFEKPIEVTVTAPQRIEDFVENNWQWRWTAILVPLAALAWKRWQSRKQARSLSDGAWRTPPCLQPF